MKTQSAYTNAIITLLEKLAATQNDALDLIAHRCAETLSNQGLIHLFGSGHSVIPTLEAFPRYGSFVGLYPLTDPRLMWHNVLGPGGVRELLWLERTENYIDKFLDHEPLNPGDVIIIYSHSGRNAAGIDTATYAKERGLFVVAVTSKANSDAPATHSSGKHLTNLADAIVDTGAPIEDALIWLTEWERPLGGSSTILASIVSHEIITRTGAVLAAEGKYALPTFVSPTVPGASISSNDEVFAEHARYIHAARGRALTDQSP